MALCWKDRTFCSSDCVRKDCFRYFGPEQKEQAEKWWGDSNAPVAFSDFTDTCGLYQKPEEQ